MQKDGNLLPTGQTLEYFNAPKVWLLCKSDAEYDERVKAIQVFNQ